MGEVFIGTYFKICVPHFPISPHALFHAAASKAHVARETSHSLEHIVFREKFVGEKGWGSIGAMAPSSHWRWGIIPLSTHAPRIWSCHGSVISPVSGPVLTPMAKVVTCSVVVLVPAVPIGVVIVAFIGIVGFMFSLTVIIAGSVQITVVQ